MIYYIGVGSNLGDRLQHLRNAIVLLKETKGIAIRKISPIYESEPMAGPAGQRDYLNGVLEVATELKPQELFLHLKHIETRLGRKGCQSRWSSREIDLDILACDDVIIKERDLEVPHPLLHQRVFVLKPLLDVSHIWRHPILKMDAAAMLAVLSPKGRCQKIEETLSVD